MPAQTDQQSYLERFYAALKNLEALELSAFRNVIMGILTPNLVEKPSGRWNYHRAAINVEMLVTIKDTKQFQVISMLARTIFELAVEIKLISLDPDAAHKIDVFTRVEKLRAAKQIVEFKKAHPEAQVHYQTHESFVTACEQSIQAEKAATWPDRDRVKHWTLNSLATRAHKLGDPFDRIYEMHYPTLSWDTHSGVISVFKAKPDTFVPSVGIAYTIAVDSYMQILEVLVNEFKLYNADPLLKNKIKYNKEVAFTESQEEADSLMQAYGLG